MQHFGGGNLKKNRLLGKPRRRWEGTIKMDLKKQDGKACSAQRHVAGCCERGNEGSSFIKCEEFVD
jgi:hypothetical protein